MSSFTIHFLHRWEYRRTLNEIRKIKKIWTNVSSFGAKTITFTLATEKDATLLGVLVKQTLEKDNIKHEFLVNEESKMSPLSPTHQA